MHTHITVRGAKEHNLKNVDVSIPRNALVVITGVSGSGKSSLAFDTIYAEGQRRYVESLSAYARQFLELMPKPNVESIDGLSPAISIEQKTTSNNPRSTVATITELYDYFRLLFARIGIPHSPTTGLPIEAQTITQMVDHIYGQQEGSKWLLLSPVIQSRKGEHKAELESLKKQGFQRVFIDDTPYDMDDLPELKKNVVHTIDVVVDRLVIKKDDAFKERLVGSLESALNLSQGLVILKSFDNQENHTLSSRFSCPVSGFSLKEMEPRLFSFNAPYGACETCKGLGMEASFSKDRIIDPTKTLQEGAILPWCRESMYTKDYFAAIYEGLLKHFGLKDQPFEQFPLVFQDAILYGTIEPIAIKFDFYQNKKPFEGVVNYLKRKWLECDSESFREFLNSFQEEIPCPSCGGMRLNEQALCVKINGLHIGEVCLMSIEKALEFFDSLTLSPQKRAIADRILKEILSRLRFLINVGLNYLTLNRYAGTLSGGESQRIRLASQLGSQLTGVLYVLDEPSIGLHQRDNDRLLETLKDLRDLGNTVIVVEHDEDAIKIADYVIDMGPRAGIHGGTVIAEGHVSDILKNPNSITGAYLSGHESIDVPKALRPGNGQFLKIIGAKHNNLKNIDVNIPLGTFTCVTGVSGSGKSSLVIDTLYQALHRHFHGGRDHVGAHNRIEGLDCIDKVINVDQSPIGRTPRSNPATYVGCFTPIREWFAKLPEAAARGYAPGRFSFNVKGGRCEACQGDGVIKIPMHFLPDVYVKCDGCNGKRYNPSTLDVLYKGRSISDVLDMTVDEGTELFKDHPSVVSKLKTLQDVGLGYIHIGQSATTLSGGEAQRVKLSKELSKRSGDKTIYILDEPTTGLHFADVKKLLEVLHKLVDKGHTVVVIEHNLDVIKTADYIIDIGPEGGTQGGKLLIQGTPKDVIKCKKSYTGQYLKQKFL